MQGIEFEEEQDLRTIPGKTPFSVIKKPSMTLRMFEKMGIEEESTANLILLGVAALLFILSMFLYANILDKNPVSKKTADDIAAELKVIKEMQN